MKKSILTIAIALIALTMVACGSKENNEPTATPTIAPTTAPETTQTPENTTTPEPTTAPEENGDNTDKSYGAVLADAFRAEITAGKDVATVASTLAATGIAAELGCDAMEISAGYLNGFDNAEISGFTKGYMFAPMIGAIPFVGYVFETADVAAAEALMTTLTTNANLRWNVCTEAAEMVCEVVENYVFFTMTPDPAEMEM